MKKKFIRFGILLGCFSGLLASCSEIETLNDLGVNYESQFAVPLFKSEASMKDVIGEVNSSDDAIAIDASGLMHVVYKSKATRREGGNISLNIPDVTLPMVVNHIAAPYTPPSGTRIDKATLENAKIKFFGSSPYAEAVNLTIKVDELRNPQTNQPLEHKVTIAAGSAASPEAFGGTIDLSGWNFVTEAFTKVINVRYTATLANGADVKLPTLNIGIEDFSAVSYAEGYFGTQSYDLNNERINIDFLQNWTSGSIAFENPKVSINVRNTVGTPTRLSVDYLSVNQAGNTVLDIESDLLNKMDIGYPALSEVGTVKNTKFVFDASNSNINDAFLKKPLSVDFSLNAKTNPEDDKSITGFATKDGYFEVDVEVDIPLKAKINKLKLVGDDIDLALDSELSSVKDIELKLIADNSIPLAAGIQLYFKDNAGVLIDSLFNKTLDNLDPIIKSATVAADGTSNGSTKNELFIDIPQNKILNFLKANKLGVTVVLDTDADQYIQLSETDKIELKAGMKVTISE